MDAHLCHGCYGLLHPQPAMLHLAQGFTHELLSDRMLEPALIKVSACIGENRTLLSRILSDLSGIDSRRERERERVSGCQSEA
ncbi:Protein GrpE [Clarias magur]|uniref:Protein GrpE n=1 Tax=Clarias magur TaxID=1594786 RepID=A0A8J4UFM2_CLAMG|nr:Protein GrpE [Clarias magur]